MVVFDGTETGYRTVDKVRWTLEDDELHIVVLGVVPQVGSEFDRILLETRPWAKIE